MRLVAQEDGQTNVGAVLVCADGNAVAAVEHRVGKLYVSHLNEDVART